MKVHSTLKKYLAKKQKSSPGFSIRALAKRLNISPSFLSRVFSGQKPLPFSLLVELRSILEIEAEVFELLKEKYVENQTYKSLVATADFESQLQSWDLVEKSSFSVLRQWFYLPILECTTLQNYDGTLQMIARRLGISEFAVQIAVNEMISLGLIKEKNGHYSKAKKKLRWGSSKTLNEVRTFHHQMMTKAQEELRTRTSDDDFSKRLITGITITASSKHIANAKKRLSEAIHEIANDLIGEDGDEVYHLSAQLFPLTK